MYPKVSLCVITESIPIWLGTAPVKLKGRRWRVRQPCCRIVLRRGGGHMYISPRVRVLPPSPVREELELIRNFGHESNLGRNGSRKMVTPDLEQALHPGHSPHLGGQRAGQCVRSQRAGRHFGELAELGRDGTGVAFVVVLNEGCLGGKAGRDRLRLRCEYHGQPCRQLRPGDHHTESVVPRIEGGLARRRAASTRQDPTDQQR
mmetsp:Transcript_37299/g.100971  ORF Transcript_37299/g.100971 Transcript_37299/m.100971 type:complete len:204 (+) Transcript_37299:1140-1751(+)